jgi:two-component system, OmpR family, phosphate regulon sensor histidine kinase PhoR
VNSKFNKIKFNSKFILLVLFGYIILQFLWWEILLVRQSNQLINEQQKLVAISTSDVTLMQRDLAELQEKKVQKTIMIVGEGTIFLLLLLYGINLIRKASKREQELMDQKNNFLLSITHELKTPLATNKLQLQTLKKHQLPIEKQKELIDVAINENERLNTLIDNVLLATRMQQNDYLLSIEKVDASEFVSSIVNTNYKREIDTKILTLDTDEHVSLNIDKIAFPSIITNLIDNAIKYSIDEIQVELKLKQVGQSVLIEVSDKGVGISDQEKLNVFNQFYRSGSEEIRRTKGTGLGLFIVKYLVEKHQGIIKVKDNKPKGTIFSIEFISPIKAGN